MSCAVKVSVIVVAYYTVSISKYGDECVVKRRVRGGSGVEVIQMLEAVAVM